MIGTPVSGAGTVVLAITLVAAGTAGVLLRTRSGRVRSARPARSGSVSGWALVDRSPGPGDRVLLLQLSSPTCAPCRRTAELLTGLAARTPGLLHLEIDRAERPEVATRLGVMRTPTVVAFDRAGTEILRVSGVPRLPELTDALAATLSDDAGPGHPSGGARS